MKAKDRICKWIWPATRCVICGGRSGQLYPGLCDGCLERMAAHREKERFCSRCGMFYAAFFRQCPRCFLERPKYPQRDGVFCAMPYDEDNAVLVKKLKYGNRRDLSETMARLFFRYTDIDDHFDAVTAVPLHRERQRQRGFNQSRELALRIADQMELPYTETLVRRVNTVSQTKLSYRERLKSMEGAFGLVKGVSVVGKRLLLVDDVVTTGATILECAAVLRQAGAARVGIASFAAAKIKDGC